MKKLFRELEKSGISVSLNMTHGRYRVIIGNAVDGIKDSFDVPNYDLLKVAITQSVLKHYPESEFYARHNQTVLEDVSALTAMIGRRLIGFSPDAETFVKDLEMYVYINSCDIVHPKNSEENGKE